MALRILCFSDLHNDVAAAERIALDAGKQGAGVMISAGDLALEEEHDLALYRALAGAGLRVLCVPGNHDGDEPYRQVVCHPGFEDIDGHVVERDGLLVAGWGIRHYDHDLSGPDRSIQQEDSVLAHVLAAVDKAGPERSILVTHLPPWGLRVARDRDGIDRGNTQLRSWVERVQPALVICGHVHHAKPMVSRIGRSRVVNPGPYGFLVEAP